MFEIVVDADITLRQISEQDADALFRLIDSSRDRLRKWLPWVDQNTAIEDSVNFSRFAYDRYMSNSGQITAGIWYKGELAGVISYVNFNLQNRRTQIGYWIGDPYEGMGIMTVSCRAMVEYAFNDLMLNRVEIMCASNNSRSAAIPERLGFRLEGTLRKYEWVIDRFQDMLIYGLLREDLK